MCLICLSSGRRDVLTPYRYLKLLTPLSPTLPNICDYLHEKQGTSFPLAHALRSDALSQIMSYADIKPGSRCLLVDDTTSHLLTSALLSRMNGQGRIMLISDTDSDPAYVAMPLFNLTEEEKAPLRVLNWAMLQSEWAPDEAAVAEGEASLGAKAKARKDSKRKRVAELEVDRQDLLAGGFDACVSDRHPCADVDAYGTVSLSLRPTTPARSSISSRRGLPAQRSSLRHHPYSRCARIAICRLSFFRCQHSPSRRCRATFEILATSSHLRSSNRRCDAIKSSPGVRIPI